MAFPIDDFLAVLEGSAPVLSLPRHFKNVTPLLHWLDSKAAAKRSACLEILNELLDRPFERCTFTGAQSIVVTIELLRPRIGRQSFA